MQPLTAVEVNDARLAFLFAFGIVVTMKTTILALVATLLMGSVAMAQSPVWGTGTAHGFCNGSNFFYCMPQLKERAERDAIREMSFICSGRGGALITTPSCSTFCTPNWMSPSDPDQMVSCRADCNAYCQN